MYRESGYTRNLGMFVTIGLVLFVGTLFFIGKQQNLFGNTFTVKSQFKTVSGLKVGNNVRFSGINVGTVKSIEIINDSAVMVQLTIEKEVQKFIKTDAKASIGSDGLMGDKVLTIYPGTSSKKIIQDNSIIASNKAVEIEDLMKGVKTTVDNAAVITYELAEFSSKLNNGKGTLSKLLFDEEMSKKLDASMSNIEAGTEGFNQNMEAAKHNFLLKGYFNKKEKEAKEKQEEAKKAKKAAEDKKAKEEKKEQEDKKAKEDKKAEENKKTAEDSREKESNPKADKQ